MEQQTSLKNMGKDTNASRIFRDNSVEGNAFEGLADNLANMSPISRSGNFTQRVNKTKNCVSVDTPNGGKMSPEGLRTAKMMPAMV